MEGTCLEMRACNVALAATLRVSRLVRKCLREGFLQNGLLRSIHVFVACKAITTLLNFGGLHIRQRDYGCVLALKRVVSCLAGDKRHAGSIMRINDTLVGIGQCSGLMKALCRVLGQRTCDDAVKTGG